MVKAGRSTWRCRRSAEIVLEGYVDPAEQRLEGPFGDHTGYYSLADMYPVFHLTGDHHVAAKPIYQTTIVGLPPMEDYWLGKATERLFLPLIQLVVPEIVDMNMPAEGVFHNLVIVSIEKRFPGHAHKVMYALWGMGQMMFARNIVVVDDGRRRARSLRGGLARHAGTSMPAATWCCRRAGRRAGPRRAAIRVRHASSASTLPARAPPTATPASGREDIVMIARGQGTGGWPLVRVRPLASISMRQLEPPAAPVPSASDCCSKTSSSSTRSSRCRSPISGWCSRRRPSDRVADRVDHGGDGGARTFAMSLNRVIDREIDDAIRGRRHDRSPAAGSQPGVAWRPLAVRWLVHR